MTNRPILLKDYEVEAILAGKKTQIRKPISPQPKIVANLTKIIQDGKLVADIDNIYPPQFAVCPFGKVGDKLWGREAWQLVDKEKELIACESIGPEAPYCGVQGDRKITWVTTYRTGFPEGYVHPRWGTPLWRSSTHMPRWASRLTLEITGVRVERLQEISIEDVITEGCLCRNWESKNHDPAWNLNEYSANVFSGHWDSCYAAKEYSWEKNPWVWVAGFKLLDTKGGV